MSAINEPASSATALSAEAAAATPTADKGRRDSIDTLSWMVMVVFGLLFAYDFWEATANFFGLGLTYDWNFFANIWILLITGMASPVVVFAAALWLGRRRVFWQRGLLLLTGWALVAAFTITVYSLLVAALAARA